MLVVQSWTIPCLCTSCFQSQILQDLTDWVCVVVCRKLGPVLKSWLLHFQEFCELLVKHDHCSNSVQSTHNYITFIKSIGSKYSKPITFLLFTTLSLFLKTSCGTYFIFKIYLFSAMPGLHCCTQAFCGCGRQGLPSSCREQASHRGGVSPCGTWAQALCRMRTPPRLGTGPMSPASAGGFFSHWSTREVSTALSLLLRLVSPLVPVWLKYCIMVFSCNSLSNPCAETSLWQVEIPDSRSVYTIEMDTCYKSTLFCHLTLFLEIPLIEVCHHITACLFYQLKAKLLNMLKLATILRLDKEYFFKKLETHCCKPESPINPLYLFSNNTSSEAFSITSFI